MSRSRRKTSICGNTTAKSEKFEKMLANRALRKRTRQALQGESEMLPVVREIRDIWNFQKDGKQYFDSQKFPKIMRK